MTPNSAQRKQDATGETCPLRNNRPTSPTWCATAPRAAAMRYPLRIRGAPDQLRRVRHQDQPRCERADRARRQAGRAHRLSRQEQRHLFRTADGRDEGQCGDGAGELAPRRPRGRLHRRRLQGAGAVRRPRVHHPGPQHQAAIARRPHRHHHRRRRAGMAGFYGLARCRRAATIRRCRSARRTSRSSSIPRAPRASPRARCCRTPTSSTWCRPATRPRSPTGTNGRPTTSRWWRCRSSISAAPAGA